ncbi:unnamed protein product [Vicia faba]|uniref:Uncharacterized protein n=1 Tax=Vicia faba TaxID=3906 RepID=A0AAV0YG70_VICFA|nr:unnamed protein product [Vicia faba]
MNGVILFPGFPNRVTVRLQEKQSPLPFPSMLSNHTSDSFFLLWFHNSLVSQTSSPLFINERLKKAYQPEKAPGVSSRVMPTTKNLKKFQECDLSLQRDDLMKMKQGFRTGGISDNAPNSTGIVISLIHGLSGKALCASQTTKGAIAPAKKNQLMAE